MTDDDLDDLKTQLNAATPTPDPQKRAEHIALAQKNFARHQETANAARQTSDRPKTGLFRGVAKMFSNLTTKGALTATTALVAFGLVIALPQLTDRPLPDLLNRGEGTPVTAHKDGDDTRKQTPAITSEAPAETTRKKEALGANSADKAPAPVIAAEPAPQLGGQPTGGAAAPASTTTAPSNQSGIKPAAPKSRELRALTDGYAIGSLAQKPAPASGIAAPAPAPADRIAPLRSQIQKPSQKPIKTL
ncbi:hypothetical protein N4R57_21760 [Rhodobacteraceae bacterium D3-12]|nr:hypothetical protein N4R57_21760 [Rhodobacteraceae bacterium D3-12]